MVPPDVAEARCALRSAAIAAEKKKCRNEENFDEEVESGNDSP